MSRRSSSAVFAVLLSLALCAPAAADSRDPINGYRVKATPQNLEKLAMAGFDVTEGRRGSRIEIFGTARQVAKLRNEGIRPTAIKDKRGRTAAQRQRARMGARAAQAGGADDSAYAVWTRYDKVPGDGKEQYREQYDRLLRQYPKITKGRDRRPHAPGPPDHRDQGHPQRGQDARTAHARRCSSTRSSTRASGWPARPAAARSTTS